jgi:hypothetical protein
MSNEKQEIKYRPIGLSPRRWATLDRAALEMKDIRYPGALTTRGLSATRIAQWILMAAIPEKITVENFTEWFQKNIANKLENGKDENG